jgi:hypothetical protein
LSEPTANARVAWERFVQISFFDVEDELDGLQQQEDINAEPDSAMATPSACLNRV